MLLNYLVVLYSPWWYLKSQLHICVTFKLNFIIRLKLGTICENEFNSYLISWILREGAEHLGIYLT